MHTERRMCVTHVFCVFRELLFRRVEWSGAGGDGEIGYNHTTYVCVPYIERMGEWMNGCVIQAKP